MAAAGWIVLEHGESWADASEALLPRVGLQSVPWRCILDAYLRGILERRASRRVMRQLQRLLRAMPGAMTLPPRELQWLIWCVHWGRGRHARARRFVDDLLLRRGTREGLRRRQFCLRIEVVCCRESGRSASTICRCKQSGKSRTLQCCVVVVDVASRHTNANRRSRFDRDDDFICAQRAHLLDIAVRQLCSRMRSEGFSFNLGV